MSTKRLQTTTRVLAGCLVLATVSCAVRLDDEEVRFAEIAEARERCVVSRPGLSRGGGFSLPFASGRYWIFRETSDASGRVDASGALSDDPCASLEPLRTETGELLEVLPLEDVERAPRSDGARVALIPRTGYVHRDVGFVFYSKALVRGVFDVTTLGVGVARVARGGVARRARPERYPHEPTLLWLDPQSAWGTSAFVAPDGRAYVHACFARGAWEHVCRVARVQADRGDDPSAYEYFDGERWVRDVERAATVLEDVPQVSIAWSHRLGRPLGVHAGFLENRVYLRVASALHGEWGRARPLFDGAPPKAFWIRDVTLHASREDRLLVTYDSDPESGPAGLRVVEVVLR